MVAEMAAPISREKQDPVTEQETDSRTSDGAKTETPAYGSYEDHPFNVNVTAEYWRSVYETAKYEGRHRFDPDFTWTAAEEKRLVRKVWVYIPGMLSRC